MPGYTTQDPLCEKYYDWTPYGYCMGNPIRYIDPDGRDNWDTAIGYGIGLVTNVIPGTGFLRDEYAPTDPSDYNNALQSIDIASVTLGSGMIDVGGTGMAVGGVAVTAGTVATVSTGGAAAIGGVPVAAVGATLIQAGATVAVGGVVLMANGKQNQDAGYNRGKNSGETKETIVQRQKPGGDGAASQHILEKDSKGNTISKTHQVKDKNGRVIHQHQDFVPQNRQNGEKANMRQFPDEWVKYPNINKK